MEWLPRLQIAGSVFPLPSPRLMARAVGREETDCQDGAARGMHSVPQPVSFHTLARWTKHVYMMSLESHKTPGDLGVISFFLLPTRLKQSQGQSQDLNLRRLLP